MKEGDALQNDYAILRMLHVFNSIWQRKNFTVEGEVAVNVTYEVRWVNDRQVQSGHKPKPNSVAITPRDCLAP